MKGKLLSISIIILCVCIFILRYEILNIYLAYKYPSPVQFSGLTIPIEKGFVYSKNKKSLRVTNPLQNSYSFIIFNDFDIAGVHSVEDYLKKLNHMVFKVDQLQREEIKYQRSYSLDSEWLFYVSFYFPRHKYMIMYCGKKDDYDNFQQIFKRILEQLPR
jgi:hypothetical protein